MDCVLNALMDECSNFIKPVIASCLEYMESPVAMILLFLLELNEGSTKAKKESPFPINPDAI